MFIRNRHEFTPFESPEWSLLVKPESDANRATRAYFAATVDRNGLVRKKSASANLRFQHKKIYQRSLTIVLAAMIVVVQLSRQFSLAPASQRIAAIRIEVADIPATEQLRKPPPPLKPSVPIPSEEEWIPEDLTIAATELDLSDDIPPPRPPDDDMALFVPYDEPPRIIGGYAELLRHLHYPRLALRAGIDGTVVVRVLVEVDGSARRVEILKVQPADAGFARCALAAIRKVKWHSARQRDKKVRVWTSMPIYFRLDG